MWGSLSIPFGDGFDIMEKNLKMDPGFREFHQYCVREGFPFNVISAGLKPVLQRTLNMFLGEKEVCFLLRKDFQPNHRSINNPWTTNVTSISHIPYPKTTH
jgi:2-hydroxy-3-keto-5-methylthiopentenyl-1-phosphate phosphatase